MDAVVSAGSGADRVTAFAQYLPASPDLVNALGFEKRPDQAPLWRARQSPESFAGRDSLHASPSDRTA
jgi:hypothetical protein